MAAPWVFEQTGGDKKVLRLEGWDAPKGRPRQGAVVSDGIEIRSKRTYYSGSDVSTRHIFGHKFDDWELTGRFMDRFGGVGYARSKTEYTKQFVADKQPVLIHWGEDVAVTAFITKFKPGRESPQEIAYTFDIEVDSDDLLARGARPAVAPANAPGRAFLMGQLLDEMLVPVEAQPPSFAGGSMDLLDSIIDSVQSAFANFVAAANTISSFEQALIGDIRRFRASLGQLKTSVIIFRESYQDFRSDLVIQSDYADEQLSFAALQAASGASSIDLMLQMVEADREAAIAERGKIQAFYEARSGDTWESIARKMYGSVTRTNDIRLANGVPPGAPPLPGTIYLIPS